VRNQLGCFLCTFISPSLNMVKKRKEEKKKTEERKKRKRPPTERFQ
jgi:hypothetical protein